MPFLPICVRHKVRSVGLEKTDEKEIKKYIPEKLGVKLFLDYDKNNFIIADVKFCYGQIEFNPVEENKDIQIARNAIQEAEYLNILRKILQMK